MTRAQYTNIGKVSFSINDLLDTSTMSPGTSSLALIGCGPLAPFLMTLAISGSYSLRASIADSALRS